MAASTAGSGTTFCIASSLLSVPGALPAKKEGRCLILLILRGTRVDNDSRDRGDDAREDGARECKRVQDQGEVPNEDAAEGMAGKRGAI